MEIELGEVQEQFAEIIWENEPVASGELVKIAQERLRVISKAEFDSAKSHKYVDKNLDL
jgi:hypothetical protein